MERIPGIESSIRRYNRAATLRRVVAYLLTGIWIAATLSCSFQRRTVEEELADDKPRLAGYYAQQAMKNQEEGDYIGAARLYRKAIDLVPYDPDLHNNLGTCYFYLGEVDSAIAEFKEAIRLLPSYSTGYLNLANAYRLQKQYDLAIAALRESLRLEPTNAQVHTTLGLTYDEMGKLDLARKEYELAVRLAPGDLVARYNLGSAYLRLGYLNPAIDNLSYVAEAGVGNESARYLLAVAYLAKCDLSRAAAELENLRESPLLRREAVNLAGIVRFAESRYPEAVDQFEAAVSMAPSVAEYRYNLAVAKLKLGQTEEARFHLDHALRLRPSWPRALLRMGETFEDQGDLQTALRYYRRAVTYDSTRSAPWLKFGRALIDLGEIDSGYVAVRRAVDKWRAGRQARGFPPEAVPVVDDWQFCYAREEEKEQYARMFIYLGKALAAKGRIKAMDAAFREALMECPTCPETYETVAEIHELLGRTSEARRERALASWAHGVRAMRRDSLLAAIRWFRRALDVVPGLAEAYLDLGRALYLSGRVDSSYAVLRQGLQIDGSRARAFVYLGDYYASKKEYEKAVAAYLKAISLDTRQVEAFRGLADVYLRMGSDDEARRMEARYHYVKAQLFLEEGETDRALDELTAALSLNQSHFAALYLKGRILQQRGLLEDALPFLRRAVEVDSTNAEARYALGAALLEKGQLQPAAEHLQAAIRLEPGMGKAYFLLARAYLDTGQIEKAEAHLRHAQDLGYPVPTEFWDELRGQEARAEQER